MNKDLYNAGLYSVKSFFELEGKYLSYEGNYHVCKSNENYKFLGSDIAQQTLKQVDRTFKTFFGSLKNKSLKPQLPKFLKKDTLFQISFPVRASYINNGVVKIPVGRGSKNEKISFSLPKNLLDKNIKEVKIIPEYNGKYFTAIFTYEQERFKTNLDENKFLAVDFGVDNLMACVENNGSSFLIDGRKLKSKNLYFSKKLSKVQSNKKVKFITNQEKQLRKKHSNILNDYLSKSVRKVINYCLENLIGNLVLGYNLGWKNKINLGRKNNQKLMQIPHGKLREKLKYLCELYNINYIEQEESYTSKSSFFDNDTLPKLNLDGKEEYEFFGKRIYRGLYKTSKDKLINADINGALNILRKSKLIDLKNLQSIGFVVNPLRIKIS